MPLRSPHRPRVAAATAEANIGHEAPHPPTADAPWPARPTTNPPRRRWRAACARPDAPGQPRRLAVAAQGVCVEGAGHTDGALDRPVIGIAAAGSDCNPRRSNAARLVLAGGLPRAFSTVSVREGASPRRSAWGCANSCRSMPRRRSARGRWTPWARSAVATRRQRRSSQVPPRRGCRRSSSSPARTAAPTSTACARRARRSRAAGPNDRAAAPPWPAGVACPVATPCGGAPAVHGAPPAGACGAPRAHGQPCQAPRASASHAAGPCRCAATLTSPAPG